MTQNFMRSQALRGASDVGEGLTARDRLVKLEAALKAQPLPRDPLEPQKSFASVRWASVVKTSAALAVIALFGWTPLQRLMATTSAEATVNGRLLTLRAPIEGDIATSDGKIDLGAAVDPGRPLIVISNPRVDRQHLDNLGRERNQLATTLAGLEDKRQVLETHLREVAGLADLYRQGRMELLAHRISETDADIAAAKSRLTAAERALDRAERLKTNDYVSVASYDKSLTEQSAAAEALRALNERRAGVAVELSYSRRGIFIQASGEDLPRSGNQALILSADLADVDARIAGVKNEIAGLDAAIAKEDARQKRLETAAIGAPVKGRVWEVLTAPGEHVNAGQDLLRILECGSASVTASVSETAYQRLSVGQAATFKPRSGGAKISGRVTALNGLAAVNSNSAIAQRQLSREPYHVSLQFPALAREGSCEVGRTGLVEFDVTSPIKALN